MQPNSASIRRRAHIKITCHFKGEGVSVVPASNNLINSLQQYVQAAGWSQVDSLQTALNRGDEEGILLGLGLKQVPLVHEMSGLPVWQQQDGAALHSAGLPLPSRRLQPGRKLQGSPVWHPHVLLRAGEQHWRIGGLTHGLVGAQCADLRAGRGAPAA